MPETAAVTPSHHHNREPLIGLSDEDFAVRIRRKGIGGSDIGAILGLSRWSTRNDVWLKKMGIPRRDTAPDNDRRRGHALEPIACEEYVWETARTLHRQPEIVLTGDLWWVRANPDRVVEASHLYPAPEAVRSRDLAQAQMRGVAEVKCLRLQSFQRVLNDGIDPSYYCQLQWYLYVMDLHWGSFIVFSGEEWKVHHFDVVRDDEFIAYLLEEGRRFWFENVMTRTPPEDGLVIEVPELLARRMRPGSDSVNVEGVQGWQGLIDVYAHLREQRELAERAEENARRAIQNAMAHDGHDAIRGYGASITWRESHTRRLDMEALQAAHPTLDLTPFYRQTATRPFRFTRRDTSSTRQNAVSTAPNASSAPSGRPRGERAARRAARQAPEEAGAGLAELGRAAVRGSRLTDVRDAIARGAVVVRMEPGAEPAPHPSDALDAAWQSPQVEDVTARPPRRRRGIPLDERTRPVSDE